jgi:hypothetical protein
MALMSFDPITGELFGFKTVPTTPTPEYAEEFLAEYDRTPTPPPGSEAALFMQAVYNDLLRAGLI